MDEDKTLNLSGLILIGGKSSRMGRPKHLIRSHNNKTWLERSVEILQPSVDRVFLSGGGEIPNTLKSLERIGDAAGYQGPMAGLMGAMEKYPERNWLVMACDMPVASDKAVVWLAGQLALCQGAALIPRNNLTGKLEPLFALYRAKAADAFRQAAEKNRFSLTSICEGGDVFSPPIPEALLNSWTNVNNEDQLKALLR